MIKLKLVLALYFVSLFVISCNPDDAVNENYTSNGFTKNFGSEVSRDFIGQVVDVNKVPIQNVTVTIGSKIVQTDVNGVFIVNDAKVFQKFAHIKATKVGFIDGSRSLLPTSGKNNVRIMLISNASTQTIQSGVVSEVTLPNGTKVKFDGAFQNSYGNPYSGIVKVSIFHLAPSNENISSLMPGMLYAQGKDGQEKGLETFGMLHVELRGSAGQKLEIAARHTAEISVQIDDSQLATAPNTIPLWHFDETNGYWKEDGFATRQGNKYVGNVAHFSWWNCDTFTSVVTLTLTILDSNGAPVSNVGVGLTVNNTNFNSYTQYTNNNGQVSGLIPANEQISLKAYNDCGDVFYTSTIGPFSSDTILPNIIINNIQSTNNFQNSRVTGHLFKCDNAIVTNGYIYLNLGNQFLFQPVQNGAFDFSILNCASTGNTFELKGYDYDTLQETELTSFTTSINTITDVGNLSTCSINEYVSIQIDNGAPISYLETNSVRLRVRSNSNGSTSGSNSGILGYNLSVRNATAATFSDNKIYITSNSNSLGIFNTIAYSMIGSDIPPIDLQMPNTLSFNLSYFGAIGDYVNLTISGSYTDTSGIQHTISLTAHVKREN